MCVFARRRQPPANRSNRPINKTLMVELLLPPSCHLLDQRVYLRLQTGNRKLRWTVLINLIFSSNLNYLVNNRLTNDASSTAEDASLRWLQASAIVCEWTELVQVGAVLRCSSKFKQHQVHGIIIPTIVIIGILIRSRHTLIEKMSFSHSHHPINHSRYLLIAHQLPIRFHESLRFLLIVDSLGSLDLLDFDWSPVSPSAHLVGSVSTESVG